MLISSYFENLIDFFFPKVCVNCQLISETHFCDECKSCLKKLEPECFVSRQKSKNWEIKKKFKLQTSLEKAYYFYEYNLIIHNLITQIKYKRCKNLIDEMAKLIIENNEFARIDFSMINKITFIPIHPKKQKVRGFNQTELLAHLLGEKLKIPVYTILEKTVNTKPQAELTREERLRNLMNSFEVLPNLELDENCNILLIDDICTTGATFEECARTIKKKYSHVKIYGLALARGKA